MRVSFGYQSCLFLSRDRRRGSSRFEEHRIDAHPARTIKENKEEDKAVENCGLAMIYNGIQSSLGVHHEVSHRHFAARNESSNARDQTECNQEAAGEFDPGAKIHNPLTRAVTARRESQ